MNTSDTLNLAADLIEERGWTQMTGWIDNADESSPVCLEGAIQAAAGGLKRHAYDAETGTLRRPLWECPAFRAVDTYLALPPGDQPYTWNDAEGRTAAEVVEVLRACAVIEASRERETAEVASC